jgi:sulfur-oxidizing protein SoxY
LSRINLQASRRDVLRAGLGLTLAAAGVLPANATPDDLRAAFKKYLQSEPKEDRVTLTIAEIAENGATVPYAVKVQSPMTAQDYVKTIYILAENNPAPEAAIFHLTPDCGAAEVSGRMRLARTQKVFAVAEMSDGTAHFAKSEIKVTVGGCGG